MPEPWIDGQDGWVEGAWVDEGVEGEAEPEPARPRLLIAFGRARQRYWWRGDEEERKRREREELAMTFKRMAEAIDVDDMEVLELA